MTRGYVYYEKNGEVYSLYHNSDSYPSRMIPELSEDIIKYHSEGKKGCLMDYIRPYETLEEFIQRGEKYGNDVDEKKYKEIYEWKKGYGGYPLVDYIYVITEDSIKIMKTGSFMCRDFYYGDDIDKKIQNFKDNGVDFEFDGEMYSHYEKIKGDLHFDYFEKEYHPHSFQRNPHLGKLSKQYEFNLYYNKEQNEYDFVMSEPNDYITQCIIHKDSGVLGLKYSDEEGWEYYYSDDKDDNQLYSRYM